MLSFAGIVRFDGEPVASAQLSRLSHRLGTDLFGLPTIWRQGCFGLVMRRCPLHAEDRAANYPILVRDGGLAVVGSARIDNRAELIGALALDPARPWHDCELIAAAFDRWEIGAADRLRGDFGFATLDLRKQQIVFAADCFGTRPIFYHRGNGFVAFATVPAALLAIGGVPRTLSQDGVADWLNATMTSRGATIYRDIRQVPRATQVVHDHAGERAEVYWAPGRRPRLKLHKDEDYVEAAREVLDDVVRGHLRSERPIGVMLSGGLDSTALAATLAQQAPHRKIFGFTTVPDWDNDDESERPFVQKLAAMYPNIEIVFIHTKSLTPLDQYWRASFDAIGLPVAGTSLVARRFAISAAASERGVGSLLNGDGGNLTFTQDGLDAFADLARSGRWLQLAKEVRLMAERKNSSRYQIFRRWVLRETVPQWILALNAKLHGRTMTALHAESYLRRDFADSIGFEGRLATAGIHRGKRVRMRERNIIVAMLEHLQPPWAGVYTLHNQRLGIQTAMPLRDRRMVDFSLSVPSTQYLRNGTTRWLARRALADRLPPGIVGRTSHFNAFPDLFQWMGSWQQAALENLDALEHSEMVKRCIDIPRLRKTLSAQLPASYEAGSSTELDYAVFLPDALHIGDFIRWTEGANR